MTAREAFLTRVKAAAVQMSPVLYSREQRAKLVFLIEARAEPADAVRLRPGQPLDVTLQ